MQLIDWSQAYDRQCPELVMKSFIANGVRKSIIPVLMNYFQERKMIVKWKNHQSSVRKLPGGGPQGCPLGQHSYTSISNDNASHIPIEDRFKWIDDLNTLEIINLAAIGLASYNHKLHVAADVGIDQKYLPTSNIKSQVYSDQICKWTQENKMKLNPDKSKVMLFNFTKKYQFAVRLFMDEKLLEIVNQSTVLGLVITADLTWKKNTEMLVRKANSRMLIIRKLIEFPVERKDLVMLYGQFVRSILEFNSNVWFSSISEDESTDLEAVQKTACKLILKSCYTTYDEALMKLNLQTLKERRLQIAKKFANGCQNIPEMKDLFEKPKDCNYDLRARNQCDVKFASRQRLYKSSVPALQRLLNC